MAFWFVSILLVYFGDLTVILRSGVFAKVCVTVLGLLRGNFQRPWVSSLLLQLIFTRAYLPVLVVLQL